MILEEIKELSKEIKEKQKRLNQLRDSVHEVFEGMSKEDMALSNGVMHGWGVKVQYYPPSTTRRVDTQKLKDDGIYENYVSEFERKSYVRVHIDEE